MFRKIKRYLQDPYHEIGYDMLWKHPDWMSDRWFLKSYWKRSFGYELDLEHPKTFNEKLQWLKLHDRKPEYTTMVDKYLAKQWVADKIGEQYIIPTLAVYNSVDEIDLGKLPDQFVLKCNHDSGNVVICKDKSMFDLQNAKEKIALALKNDYYLKWREWPYKNVKSRILVEKYMEDGSGELIDYKFFCFNGYPKVILVCSERFSSDNMYETWLDDNWNILPIVENGHRVDEKCSQPLNFDLMKELAIILSKDITFARIDFYEINGKVYFGEITFFPASGFEKFEPEEWNKTLGDWIELPID